ncbi:MAG TPA: DNA starvation/stationary phase protection protein [Solirubrobacteraceae bacterium]|jgi:starvation-inducible DNA-binding protein|nr:DNA starvation/stationary phase protection protein [Solirubrobacteraceae bacterium]
MASTQQEAHLPALGAHQREEVGNQLQGMLVELIDLALVGKQLHWNVTGPLFRPLHEQLDELVDSWRELSDVVAERAVALGYAPDGQSGAVAAVTELKPIARGPLEDHVVIRELSERMNDVADRARERMDKLGEIDAASQDVIIEVVRALEQQLWMIRVQFGHAVQS